jgi:hypothetical protein
MIGRCHFIPTSALTVEALFTRYYPFAAGDNSSAFAGRSAVSELTKGVDIKGRLLNCEFPPASVTQLSLTLALDSHAVF